jgi:hypothetical protein
MFLSLQRNQGNDFLWNEILEELAFRKLKLNLQILRECTEPCNYVWIAYTILSLQVVSNRLQACYCRTSGYVPKPVGYEQDLVRGQRALDQDSPNAHPRVGPAESHGDEVLSGAQLQVKPARKIAIRPVIPLNYASLHPLTPTVVPKKDVFKLSATSAPFVPSASQTSLSGVSRGYQAGMNANFMPVKNEQFTSDDAGEEVEEGVVLGSDRECEQHNACIRTLFTMAKGGYLNF